MLCNSSADLSMFQSVEKSGVVDSAVSRVELDLDTDSRNEMLKIIERLSESECLEYEDLILEFGFNIVRQMISLNLLFYRATKSISGDFDGGPWRPVVTASCVPVLRAMQLITKRLKSKSSHGLKEPAITSAFLALPPEQAGGS